jgi:hypothetical protein
VSLTEPRDLPSESNVRPWCKHQGHAEPLVTLPLHRRQVGSDVAAGAWPVASRAEPPEWLDEPRPRLSHAGASLAQYPIGWIHHLRERLPALGGGLSARARSSARAPRPRMPDSWVSRGARLRSVAAAKSILTDPAKQETRVPRNVAKTTLGSTSSDADRSRLSPLGSEKIPLVSAARHMSPTGEPDALQRLAR